MNKTIGLFGVALHSTNYGVTALGISQIAMLESIESPRKKQIALKIIFRSKKLNL